MCPIPPTDVYESIAENAKAPQNLRDAALFQLKQTAIQSAVGKVASTVEMPSTGNTDFTCSVYSLMNKTTWEDLEVEEGDPSVSNPKEVMHFPGIKVQDTDGFIAKNPDGTVLQDKARQLTFDGFRATYDFYKKVFGRNSIDNRGMEIRASIHFMRGLDNAFWSGEKQQMIFGDGGRFDGRGWLPPTEAELKGHQRIGTLSNWFDNYDLDTIGHELTHGVVSHTAKLGNKQWRIGQTEKDKDGNWTNPQSRALYSEAATLNEHIADCFGVMLKHYVHGHTAETGNWDFSPNVWSQMAMDANGWTENYCRTFRVPDDISKSPDKGPKHWDKRRDFSKGKYGLDSHVNGGIASHAFYLAALDFKGNTWEGVGKVWYNALTDKEFEKPENQTFVGWKALTLKHAEGTDGKNKLKAAWEKVGL